MDLTKEQIIYLKPIASTGPGGNELCAAVEYRSEHGVGYFPLVAVVAESVLQCPEMASIGDLQTLKFIQNEDLRWKAVFAGSDAKQAVEMNVDGQVIKELLQKAGYPNTLLDMIQAGPDVQDAQPQAPDSAPPWE